MELGLKEISLRYKIAHITVHMGGGVGSVLMNLIEADRENEHRVICLNNNYYRQFDKNIVQENMRKRRAEIAECIAKVDIVIVHFWNHPLLFEFLVQADIPDCRMALWSHVSGLHAPYVISEKLVRFSDRFIFSSPISYEVPEVKALPKELKYRLGSIWTTGDIASYFKVVPEKHEGFNIGFVGTLDFSKLHPNFIDMCAKIDMPDVKFIMIGGGCDTDKIKQQANDKGILDRFHFTGVIKDIRPFLAVIDVLGYPLNPKHFGTCEQVLGEAVAAGVIPIVMNNPAEEYILLQTLIHYICHNEDEYVNKIKLLYEHKGKRTMLISLMQDSLKNLYHSNRMVGNWSGMFDDMMFDGKRKRVWTISDKRASMGGAGIYIESLGDYGRVLESGNVDDALALFGTNRQWKSASKGSPRQYWYTFQDDELLLRWCKLAEQGV